MSSRVFYAGVLAVLFLLAPLLFTACGDGDAGLSRAEVGEIVRAEMAEAPAPPQLEPGLTTADVQEGIRKAMADMPQPESGLSESEVEEIAKAVLAGIPQSQPGLTSAEAERIARGVVASIPPKSAPAEYTKFFVNNAISRYDTQGLDATLTYYNRGESVDGQWYVFIIDENDLVIGHPESHRLGLDVNGWVGIDANGYNFGPEMLTATEEGRWVSYVYRNPESGGLGSDNTGTSQLKNAWVVRHDGLLFAAGWYINADEFTKSLVAVAVNQFRSGGLEGMVAYFASPESAFAGLQTTIDYYNNAEGIEGQWFNFIADRSGEIIVHSDPGMIGRETREVFGSAAFDATGDGVWVTT